MTSTPTQPMTTSEVLAELFTRPVPADGRDLVAFLRRFGPSPEGVAHEDPFRRLMRVALRADRRSAAAIAGHQASIRRLFPATPADAICAFCISEDRGPHPKYIDTTLTDAGGGLRLNGTKRFGSVAPDADLLYVAASVGRDGDRNDLRMVALPADRGGITLDAAPYASYGPDMSIADVILDDVEVRSEEVIPGDAYLNYVKPFRLVEDVYNTVGVQIGLFRLGVEHGWPQERVEELVALIVHAAAISSTDMASPSAVLLLSAYFRASADHWTDLWRWWTDVPASVVERWHPDRPFLETAARARETRRQTAWESLIRH